VLLDVYAVKPLYAHHAWVTKLGLCTEVRLVFQPAL